MVNSEYCDLVISGLPVAGRNVEGLGAEHRPFSSELNRTSVRRPGYRTKLDTSPVARIKKGDVGQAAPEGMAPVVHCRRAICGGKT